MSRTNDEVKQAIRETLEDQLEDHDLPEVFWSLDAVYDEYDEKMTEHELTEVPIFTAEVVVPDDKATSGRRYKTLEVDGVESRAEAEDRLDDNPEVISVESLEQTDTARVFL